MTNKIKVYKGAGATEACQKEFAAVHRSGRKTEWLCTRIKGHTGPCQWVLGQQRKNKGEKGMATYTQLNYKEP